MNNLPLYVLFWTAVPYAIYRSKRRWRTFFVTLGSWFGSAVILAFTAVPFYTRLNAQRMGELTREVMVLVAILFCVWHSQKTRKGAIAADPPSVII